MKYWFDTEFHDRTDKIIDLISIGVVAEDGREYYAVSADYDRSLADEWLRNNVLNQLGDVQPKPNETIHQELLAFFSQDDSPEFWTDCGEYDWVVLRQLFGTLIEWPSGWTYTAMDIEQWRIHLNAPKFPQQEKGLHNALEDAKHTKKLWHWLDNINQKFEVSIHKSL